MDFFHYSNFYTLPFCYLGDAISKTVSLSSLALLLDSSNEGFWCTECNAKNLSSLQSIVNEKIEKTWPKWSKWPKMAVLARFSLPTPEVEGLERKERQFYKWHDLRNKIGGCRSCYSGKSPLVITLMCCIRPKLRR